MIEGLQQGAKGAAQAMEKGQGKARHSLEQGAVAEDINRNVVAIRDLSSKSAEGAEQTAVASTQQARLAADLQAIAAKFVI